MLLSVFDSCICDFPCCCCSVNPSLSLLFVAIWTVFMLLFAGQMPCWNLTLTGLQYSGVCYM